MDLTQRLFAPAIAGESKPVRLLIADDHQLIREGFQSLSAKYPDIELAGEARDGVELLEMVSVLNPDIIITDIKMPRMNGIEATSRLTRQYPSIRILAFTICDDEALVLQMLEAGAIGCLQKSAEASEIMEAIHAAVNNRDYFGSQAFSSLSERRDRLSAGGAGKLTGQSFTPREMDVIRLICQEYSGKEIASFMKISPRTVEWHRDNIQEKMKVKNTAGLVIYAIRHGIFKVEPA